MAALESHHRADRHQAIRLAFRYAQEAYGLSVQRLRGGGRAERAIKSAINSAIRQGWLERDGAMYLVCVAEAGEAIQRGLVEDGARPPESSAEPPQRAPGEPEGADTPGV
jgi:hypothetical protein